MHEYKIQNKTVTKQQNIKILLREITLQENELNKDNVVFKKHMEAIKKAGYTPGVDVNLAIDVAAHGQAVNSNRIMLISGD